MLHAHLPRRGPRLVCLRAGENTAVAHFPNRMNSQRIDRIAARSRDGRNALTGAGWELLHAGRAQLRAMRTARSGLQRCRRSVKAAGCAAGSHSRHGVVRSRPPFVACAAGWALRAAISGSAESAHGSRPIWHVTRFTRWSAKRRYGHWTMRGFARTLRSNDQLSADPPERAERQRSEQYFTSCQTRAHFLRQANGSPQCAHVFEGRSPFLIMRGMMRAPHSRAVPCGACRARRPVLRAVRQARRCH